MRPAGEAEASQASLRQALETARGLLDRRHHSLSRRPQVTGWQVAVPVLVAALFLGPWVLGRQGAPSRSTLLRPWWRPLGDLCNGSRPAAA
ncbi:unnamed protein product [Prorocentrum cordatum]|nr:unnamed protein product [Polarella glacialis]